MRSAVTTKYRVGGILLLVLAGFAGSRFIDTGHTRAWPDWARFLFAGTLLFAIVGAVILFLSILSPEHSDLSLARLDDHRGPTLRRGLLIATALFLVFAALARALAVYAGISEDRTLVAGFGLALGWCTLRKPWWFWDHWKAGFVRGLIGDQATTIVYLVFAALLLYAALSGHSSEMVR